MTYIASSDNSEKKATPQSLEVVSSYALQLTLMEVGLGSFLHAFHVPFSGFFLSLNQCFVLNRALIVAPSASNTVPMTISNTTAILKTLSPYGKRFTPMLAISMQGMLFNLGTIFLGKNLLGRCLGSFFLSLWPLVQPIIVYGIIYGSIFVSMSESYSQIVDKLPWMNDMTVQTIVGAYVFVHVFLSLMVCLLTTLLPARIMDEYDRYISSYREKVKSKTKLRGVWKDFTSPFFLGSLVLSGIFFYVTLHSLEAFFFVYFRLIAAAFLTFYLIRKVPAEWCIRQFSRLPLMKRCAPYVEEVLLRMK